MFLLPVHVIVKLISKLKFKLTDTWRVTTKSQFQIPLEPLKNYFLLKEMIEILAKYIKI